VSAKAICWAESCWRDAGHEGEHSGAPLARVLAHAESVFGPPTPPIAEPCGCDESKALRVEVARLQGQIQGMLEALPHRDAAMREQGARGHVVRDGGA
jgi:hypothetical protein